MELQSRLVRGLVFVFTLAVAVLAFAAGFTFFSVRHPAAMMNGIAALGGFWLVARNRPGSPYRLRWLGPLVLGGFLFFAGFFHLATSGYPFFGWCDLVLGACFTLIAVGVGLRFPVDEMRTQEHLTRMIDPHLEPAKPDALRDQERRSA